MNLLVNNRVREFSRGNWNKVFDDKKLAELLRKYFTNPQFWNATQPRILNEMDTVSKLYKKLDDVSKLDFYFCFPYIQFHKVPTHKPTLKLISQMLFQNADILVDGVISELPESELHMKSSHANMICNSSDFKETMPENYMTAIGTVSQKFSAFIKELEREKKLIPKSQNKLTVRAYNKAQNDNPESNKKDISDNFEVFYQNQNHNQVENEKNSINDGQEKTEMVDNLEVHDGDDGNEIYEEQKFEFIESDEQLEALCRGIQDLESIRLADLDLLAHRYPQLFRLKRDNWHKQQIMAAFLLKRFAVNYSPHPLNMKIEESSEIMIINGVRTLKHIEIYFEMNFATLEWARWRRIFTYTEENIDKSIEYLDLPESQISVVEEVGEMDQDWNF